MFLGRQLVSDKILDVLRLGRSCKLAVSDFLLENEDQPGIHRSNYVKIKTTTVARLWSRRGLTLTLPMISLFTGLKDTEPRISLHCGVSICYLYWQFQSEAHTEQGGQTLSSFQEFAGGHSIAMLLVKWDIGVRPLHLVEECGSWSDSWGSHIEPFWFDLKYRRENCRYSERGRSNVEMACGCLVGWVSPSLQLLQLQPQAPTIDSLLYVPSLHLLHHHANHREATRYS